MDLLVLNIQCRGVGCCISAMPVALGLIASAMCMGIARGTARLVSQAKLITINFGISLIYQIQGNDKKIVKIMAK